MRNLLYFHGLNSDKTLRKYLNIKEKFDATHRVRCIEWKNDTDIDKLLDAVKKKYENEENLVLVGDSTGGNFAYQLKERRKSRNQKSVLILLNPLLDIAHKTGKLPFPESLKPFLESITQPQDAFILLGKEDEILDHSFLANTELSNTRLFWVDDSHRLPRFKEFLGKIAEMIF